MMYEYNTLKEKNKNEIIQLMNENKQLELSNNKIKKEKEKYSILIILNYFK